MALTLALFSLFAQAIGFVGISYLIMDLLVLPRVFYPNGGWSVADLLPYALETAIGYWPILLLCAIGVVAAALLMVRVQFSAPWFLMVCRFLGWLWMLFLPIGPIFGVILLRARTHALSSECA